MGLSVAKSLLSQDWIVAIVDYAVSGSKISQEIGAAFFQADVSDYNQVGNAFVQTWALNGRLDFGMFSALETVSH